MALSNLQGYNYGNPIVTANGCNPVMFASICTRKMGLNFKGASKVRASLVSHPTGNGVVAGETGFVDGLVDHKTRIEIQPDVIGFGTLAAEIIPMTGDFFDDEYDLDHPTEGFASIPEAIEDIHQGKDAKHGTTTGVSASDRATTVLALAFGI